MRAGKVPVCFPVDHHFSFSGHRVEESMSRGDVRRWPGRRRLGVFVVIALAAWIVVLSPLLLID